MNLQIILAITFVFGFLPIISNTKLFDARYISTVTSLIFGHKNELARYSSLDDQVIYYIKKLLLYLGDLFFYFSICFQAWYWLFKNI